MSENIKIVKGLALTRQAIGDLLMSLKPKVQADDGEHHVLEIHIHRGRAHKIYHKTVVLRLDVED